MRQVIQHETLGEIVYEESAWTGKKSLSVGGVQLERVSKKEFKMSDGSVVTVRGGFLGGATAEINNETIQLTPKLKWYEVALGFLPFVLVLIWGNMPALCQIIPVVGGLIGGAISGACSVFGILGMKSVKPIWLKLVIALVSLVVAFGICAGIGYAIVSALS